MATRYQVVVSLSDRTSIEYSTYAESKAKANAEVLRLFSNKKIQSIHSQKA